MKKILMVMLGLVAGTASFAANKEPNKPVAAPTRLVMNMENKLRFYVQPLQAKGQLAIRDANGRPVYTSTVALHKGLYRQFDFSNLVMGTYRFTLATEAGTFQRTFVVQGDPNTSFVVQEP